jgi:hypothetical protein
MAILKVKEVNEMTKMVSLIDEVSRLGPRSCSIVDRKRVTQQFLYEHENVESYRKGGIEILKKFLETKPKFLVGTREIMEIAEKIHVDIQFKYPDNSYFSKIKASSMTSSI